MVAVTVKHSGREIRTCDGCGSAFDFKLSQLNSYPRGGRYCSRLCKATGHEADCARCGTRFRGPENARFCSGACRERAYEILGPIDRKAWSLAANLLWGVGKAERMRAMLRAALGTACPYCAVELTLQNIGLDHIEPLRSHDLRRKKAENKVERRWADRPENIQFTCRPCNSLKGRLNDRQFRQLLALTDSWGEDGERFLAKLRSSSGIFTLKRITA